MKIFFNLKFIFFLYLIFLAGYLGYGHVKRALEPVSPTPVYKIVDIPKGSSFKNVAQLLEEKGLIRSKEAFWLLAWYRKELNLIKAGEYKLSPSMTPERILDILVAGQVVQHMVTIPEGFNMFQIADLLKRAGLVKKKEFLAVVTDKEFLKTLGINQDSAEGYLFPDSYFLPKGVTPKDIVKIFTSRFWQVWHDNNFDERVKELGLTINDVVTLASIVELEAAVQNEKPIIASVFWNRLNKGMPLQADPTVKYGILIERKIKKRRLTWKDLRKSTPYNTYTRHGLPKGPICNPGLISIRAVLYPKTTKYLYFVSKGNRTHYFSKTLKEHNRAVKRYILNRRHRH
ncbi:MAG: endolytic transglycosylase MltG [Thermodesulfobacteria bacterium]|nr:endolytic transglycosylase MltG [Thermodesulfobacteriota bacterium]